MSTQPLTHHQILELVEPFTRRGRHVDLAASNRLERRLVFKAVEHADLAGRPTWRETLQLENPKPDRHRLTRVLTLAGGLQATLQAEGSQPDELLARIEAVAPERQFLRGAGFVAALSHDLGTPASAAGGVPGTPRMILRRAVSEVNGLTLTMKLSSVTGVPAEVELKDAAADPIDLPDDLLAVLGWPWARLTRVWQGWNCVLRLRGSEPERSRDAERKLQSALEHLERTLEEPPARFHDRLRGARWRVTLRRAFPLLASAALIAGAAALPTIDLAQDSVARMLIFHTPPLLLVMFFAMREMPRIEIPPLPRRSAALAWRTAPARVPAASSSPDMRPG